MKKKMTCEAILDDLGGAFNSLGNGLEAFVDQRPRKMAVAKGVLGFGFGLTKAALRATGCAVKHAPKAAVAIAQAKRDLVNTIEKEYAAYEKEQQEERMRERLEQLKAKTQKHHNK